MARVSIAIPKGRSGGSIGACYAKLRGVCFNSGWNSIRNARNWRPDGQSTLPLEAEPRFDNRRFLRGKMSFKDNRIQRYALRRLESPRLFIREILNHENESNFHLNPLFSKTFIRIIRYRRKKKKKDLSTSIKIIPWFEN